MLAGLTAPCSALLVCLTAGMIAMMDSAAKKVVKKLFLVDISKYLGKKKNTKYNITFCNSFLSVSNKYILPVNSHFSPSVKKFCKLAVVMLLGMCGRGRACVREWV